ncbi:antibiotic biosynthesis monooxygenase [Rugamonas sp.]|uniref:antibiotic biosynthesis monooxygenase family protein n=1 Tax=Rugamonas sp. TaxID=1926287 RepID=UPI0025F67E10|nr:antibiotic biosynthesis monooxygenase family protein [Rugamonas sp.]
MIYEIAELTIKPDTHAAFEAAVTQAVPLFQRAAGCVSMRMERGIEAPDTYLLVVGWQTVEHHMVDFRDSADFQEWRRLVGDYFAQAPKVHHYAGVVAGFGG